MAGPGLINGRTIGDVWAFWCICRHCRVHFMKIVAEVSARRKLRERSSRLCCASFTCSHEKEYAPTARLGCKTFDWFLDNVATEVRSTESTSKPPNVATPCYAMLRPRSCSYVHNVFLGQLRSSFQIYAPRLSPVDAGKGKLCCV